MGRIYFKKLKINQMKKTEQIRREKIRRRNAKEAERIENMTIQEDRDKGKISLWIAELKCHILVSPEKINTTEKKKDYIKNYVDVVTESRNRIIE